MSQAELDTPNSAGTAAVAQGHARLQDDHAGSSQAEGALAAAAERDSFLMALNDRIRPLRDPVDIQSAAVHVLRERLETDWVHYTEFDTDTAYATVFTADIPAGSPGLTSRHALESFKPLIAQLMTGRTIAVADLDATLFGHSMHWSKYAAAGLRAFVGAPILKDGHLCAAFGVASRVPRAWTSQEIAFIEETAERTWSAVERSRAEQAVALELRDARMLHDLSVRLVSEADTTAFFDAILAAAGAITSAAGVSLRMHDPTTQSLTLLAAIGFEEEFLAYVRGVGPGPSSSILRAFASGQGAAIDFEDGTLSDPQGVFRRLRDAGFKSAHSTPLVTREGRVIGVLSVHWQERRRASERELRFLDLLARQAAELIERRRAEEALRVSQQLLSTELEDAKQLHRLGAQLIEEEDSSGLYDKIVEAAQSMMRADSASLQTYHPEREGGGALRLLTSRGFSPEAIAHWTWVDADAATTCAEALRRGMRVAAPDLEHCEFMADTADQAMYRRVGARGGQSTPLISRAGKTVGMISTYWCRPHQPSERDLRLMDLLARQAADLMERAQAIEALKRSESQLKEADRRKDEFLAVLAHELRNPLAPIRTSLEVIRIAGDQAELVDDARSIIERQVGHMVRLIDDLLDVSRIASGKIQLRRQHSLLSGLVSTAVEAMRATLADATVSLDVALPAEVVYLDVDPTRFVQILSNVIHNAIKFSHPGGSVALSVILQRPGDGHPPEASFVVRDSGVGISPDLLPHVFELFTQDSSHHVGQPGLGIGLALARQLIELHGGSIEAHSEGSGLGSTFVVRMPLSVRAESAEPPEAPPIPRRTERRVMIIDDNADAARAMSHLVTAMGGECRVAYNGETGLREVQAFGPDIVFLDIGMPGLDGYEAGRRLRAAAGSDVLVVALTGFGQDRDKEEASRAGFDLHFTKPADPLAIASLLVHGRSTPSRQA